MRHLKISKSITNRDTTSVEKYLHPELNFYEPDQVNILYYM